MYRRIFGSIFCCIFLFQLTACGFERLGRMTEFFEIEDAQENEANKLLYYAISEVPNLEAVKEAVERGADVNRLLAYPTKDNVLLYYSGEHMGQDSFNNHPGVDVASYLLENGADPNVVLKNGINLLMYSCDALPISGA